MNFSWEKKFIIALAEIITHATVLVLARPGLFRQEITVEPDPAVCAPVKNVLKFKIEFEIQHDAHTLDCNDPDLEAFESNLCAINRARESDL